MAEFRTVTAFLPMATIDLFHSASPLQVACVESQPFGQNTRHDNLVKIFVEIKFF